MIPSTPDPKPNDSHGITSFLTKQLSSAAQLVVSPIQAAVSRAAYYLPHTHTADIKRLNGRVEQLGESGLVDIKIANHRERLERDEKRIQKRYKEICGTHYEDPSSKIHQAWVFFKTEESKLPTGTVFDYPDYSLWCSNPKAYKKSYSTPELQKTFKAFREYTKQEQERQRLVAKIEITGSWVNSDTELQGPYLATQKNYEEQLRELSGNYYGDPNCKLDQSWKNYEQQRADGASQDAIDTALNVFQDFDKMRKVLEHLLFMLGKMLGAPETSSTNIRAVAEQGVVKEKKLMENRLERAQAANQVNWPPLKAAAFTALTAATTTLLL
jgi:hypothetical protein